MKYYTSITAHILIGGMGLYRLELNFSYLWQWNAWQKKRGLVLQKWVS